MKRFVVLTLVIAWLLLWAADTGVLVLSIYDREYHERVCRYVIGLSVVRRVVPADRCPLLTRL